MPGRVALAAVLLALLVDFRCATYTSTQSAASAPTTAAVWEGTTQASCDPFTRPGRCNARNRITLSLFQKGDKITGTYSCATGNIVCFNGNDTGKIVAGQLIDTQLRMLRIQMSDGTGCIYNGTLSEANGQGGYQCMAGGSILEQGSWRVARAM